MGFKTVRLSGRQIANCVAIGSTVESFAVVEGVPRDAVLRNAYVGSGGVTLIFEHSSWDHELPFPELIVVQKILNESLPEPLKPTNG